MFLVITAAGGGREYQHLDGAARMLVNIVQGTGQSPAMKRHQVGRPVSTEVEKLVFGKPGVVVMYPWGCCHYSCCLEGAH